MTDQKYCRLQKNTTLIRGCSTELEVEMNNFESIKITRNFAYFCTGADEAGRKFRNKVK